MSASKVLKLIKDKVKSTHTQEVLTGIGSFGSLYSIKELLSDYKNPVLVQSIDGVGTKTLNMAKPTNVFESDLTSR